MENTRNSVKKYSAHLHTNSTQNDRKQTIHRTTQQFGRVRAVPCLGYLYPGICLATEEKSRENVSQSSRVEEFSQTQIIEFVLHPTAEK